MRILSSDQENKTFALLRVRNGQSLIINGKINPSQLHLLMSYLQDLIENDYSDLHNISTKTSSCFQKRVILSPINDWKKKCHVECKILIVFAAGETVLVPKIPIIPTN